MKLGTVQIFRKTILSAIVLIGFLVISISDSSYQYDSPIRMIDKWIGLIFIIVFIFGRSWASLYIGGRKDDHIVTTGPYSICRNPLYVFSAFGAVGISMQTGSIVIGLCFGLVVILVFFLVTKQEEKRLVREHGDEYLKYKQSVPRYVPKFSLWRDQPTVAINSKNILRTFGDSTLSLTAIPVADILSYLHKHEIIPVLFRLP
jgi:protein-S-isoprenylcysteine O-methyltransferase Ste14